MDNRQLTEFEREEIISEACQQLLEGVSFEEIGEDLKKKDPLMTRQKVYPMIVRAAKAGWLQFTPPPDQTLARLIRKRFRWLEDNISVAKTATSGGVANQATDRTLSFLR